MTNNEQLQALIKAAKTEEPLVELSAINATVTKLSWQQKFTSTLKYIAMTTGVLGLLFAVYWLTSTEKEQVILREVQSEKPIQEQGVNPILEKSNVAKIEEADSSKEKSTINLNQADDVENRNFNTVYHYLPPKEKTKTPFVYQEKPTNSTQDSFAVLKDYLPVLSESDWRKLHVTVKKKGFEYSFEETSDSTYHRIKYLKHGAYFGQDRHGTFTVTANERFEPLGFSNRNGVNFKSTTNNGFEIAKNLQSAKKLVGFLTQEKGYVIWYPINADLLRQLPVPISNKIKKGISYEIELKSSKTYVHKPIIPQFPNRIHQVKYTDLPFVDSSLITDEVAYTKGLSTLPKERSKYFNLSESKEHLILKGKIKGGVTSLKIRSTLSSAYMSKSTALKVGNTDLLPLYVSSEKVNDRFFRFYPTYHFKEHPYQHFLTKRHTLHPVKVPLLNTDTSLIFWYEPSFKLFDALNIPLGKQQELLNQYLQTHKTDSSKTDAAILNPVSGNTMVSSPAVKVLELDATTLGKLGIFVEDGYVNYTHKHIRKTFRKKGTDIFMRSSWSKNGKSQNVKISIPGLSGGILKVHDTVPGVTPKYITDDLAQNWRQASVIDGAKNYSENRKLKIDSLMQIDMNSNYLIPILVRTYTPFTKADKRKGHYRPDCIFWYEPNEDFLEVLPDGIAVDIKSNLKLAIEKEITAIEKVVEPQVDTTQKPDLVTEKSNGASCTYFEICQQEIETVAKTDIYPNPATNLLKVEVESLQACDMTYSIHDIKGKQVVQYKMVLKKGTNTAIIPIEHIKPGIYLLSMQSSLGDLIVERIVKR